MRLVVLDPRVHDVKHEEGAVSEGADNLDLVRYRTKVHALPVRRDIDPAG